MNTHSLRNVNNQLDVGVVIIIRAPGYLHVLISHPDVVCICLQIFRCCHHRELNCALIAENFVGPFSYGSNLLDSRNTVVGDEDLKTVSKPF